MTRALAFIDFERAVIAAVLCWPEQSLPLVPEVEIDDFGEIFHRHAWSAIRNLEAAGKAIEILAVADELIAYKRFVGDDKLSERDECDVVCGLGVLVLESPHVGDAGEHTRRLHRYARALRTIRRCREEYVGGAV